MIEKLAGGHFTLNDGVKHYLSCYGYVDGRLYIGSRHHMGIMEFLLSHGYTFETLMDASQAWGWLENAPEEYAVYYPNEPLSKKLQIRFSTDAAAIDFSLEPEVCAAFEKALGYPVEVTSKSNPTNQNQYAPAFQQGYGNENGYWKTQGPIEGCYVYDSHDGFLGWVDSTDTSKQFPPPQKEPAEDENSQLQLFDHPVPGGGAPPPKKPGYDAEAQHFLNTGELESTSAWQEVEDLWYDDEDVEEDFLALPQSERLASLPPVTRLPWMIRSDGSVEFGQPEDHHVDLGYDGDEPASGDVKVGIDLDYNSTPGQITLSVLDLEPHIDFADVVGRVKAEWDRLYPENPITSVKNATPESYSYLTNQASYDILGGMNIYSDTLSDPEFTNGWEVRQMESGEYTHHHAIVIDRNHHRLFINYNGHHGPLIDAAVHGEGIPYHDFMDTTMGHYRLEPSTTEPFAEGWGFHGGSGKPEELEALAHHIRQYHNVSDLEDAWVSNKVASVKWLNVCPSIWTMSVKWKAVFDKAANELYIWKTCGDNAHHVDSLADFFPGKVFKTGNIKKNSGLVQAEGTYITPSYVIAPGSTTPKADVNKVRKLLVKALEEQFPSAVLQYTDESLQLGAK